MKRRGLKVCLGWTLVALGWLSCMPSLSAQHRGNLGNGGVGGGGGRPGPQALPNASRPAPQTRPAMPQPKLPSGGGNIGNSKLPSARPSLPSAKPNLPAALPGNNAPGNNARPNPITRPNINPTNNNKPNLGSGTPGLRPGALPGGGMVKPNEPTTKPAPRPGLGPTRPSPGIGVDDKLPPSRPTTRPTGPLRPTTLPGQGSGGLNRPNIEPPLARPPVTKPSLPDQRPTTKPAERPNLNFPNRPNDSQFNNNRPNNDRPSIRPQPGDRLPGITTKPADRPSLGGPNRPNFGNNGNPNRPDFGGNNNSDRPILGGNQKPNRPIIGGGNNNNIGNNININNNNFNNININRPGWNNNWNGNWNNGWNNNWNNNWNNGWNGNWNNNQWGDYWYSNHINYHHQSWYHGCWHGNWGGTYYRPAVYGAAIWGLYGWGYQPVYYNPYYVTTAVSTTPVYNYSQPIVVNNYSTTSTDNSSVTNSQAAADNQAASNADYSQFDECLQLFKAGNFRQALRACDEAIAKSPKDPVLHEVRALIQFALGQYGPAAAVLNSLLASSPGMDWTTMSSLYDDIDTYTQQLRLLEEYCKANPKDAPAQFVLAYHYIVAGYNEEAAELLKVVVELQPKDLVAKRILESLVPPAQSGSESDSSDASRPPTPASQSAANQPKTPPEPKNGETKRGESAATTDLVGQWKATEGKGAILLNIDEDYKFLWKATNEGSPAVELDGNLMIQGEMMILSNQEQGNLAGEVVSGGADKFTFVPSGSPKEYPGLTFERVSASK